MDSPLTLAAFPVPIIHVDADAFFTSVEQALKPELTGKPVITGRERGIVACASYEAKALGIRRPMRLFEARKISPDLICLPSDYETYSLYSQRIFAILRRFTPAVEEYSIDEAFAELGGLRRLYRTGYPEIARQIKQTIEKELGITVSVGLSASKTLAKLASRQNKPNGFTVWPANELQHFLPEIPLEKVCGFGPNTTALLRKNGLRNVWDYIQKPQAWAKQLLGKIGVELWHELRAEAVYPITAQPKTEYLSMSKTKTFTPPSPDKNYVRAQLLRNMESALIKLRHYKFRTKKFIIYLRTQDFKSHTIDAELGYATRSPLEMANAVTGLFEKLFRPYLLYRATGIILYELENDESEMQLSLFDSPQRIKSFRSLDRVIDGVNELFGKHTLHLGSTLWLGRHRWHASERGDLPQRKNNLLPGENFRRRLGIPMWQIRV